MSTCTGCGKDCWYAKTCDQCLQCRCAKWRLRAFAIRCCTLARKSEFIENQARILALAADANAKADLEECHAGRLHP